MITTRRIEEKLRKCAIESAGIPSNIMPPQSVTYMLKILRDLCDESKEDDQKRGNQLMKDFHKEDHMTFIEAIKALQSNNTIKVSRKKWDRDNRNSIYLYMKKIQDGDTLTDTICESTPQTRIDNVTLINWSAKTEDILADDWYIVK